MPLPFQSRKKWDEKKRAEWQQHHTTYTGSQPHNFTKNTPLVRRARYRAFSDNNLPMFRNGFNATRRSLLTVAHPRPHTVHKELPSSNFVCISCQFRTAHSASKHSSGRPVKKGRGTKSNTFLGAIKRLEAHVQHIEKTYADRVKQYDAQQVRC